MFTASASTDQTVSDGDKIKFDNVWTNIGGGFSGSTSEFSCTVAGYYMFSVTAMSELKKDVEATIVSTKGDVCPELWVDEDSGDGSLYSVGSTTCMMHCEQGHKVWVKSTYTDSVLDASHHSHFSGALIKPEI